MAFQVMPGVLATVQICLIVREKREARRLRKHAKPAGVLRTPIARLALMLAARAAVGWAN